MRERQIGSKEVRFSDGVEPKKPSVKPGAIDAWETRKAVVDTLFEIGKPTIGVKEGACGENVPNEYTVYGKTVEHYPTWDYAFINDGKERTFVPLDLSKGTKTAVENLKKVL